MKIIHHYDCNERRADADDDAADSVEEKCEHNATTTTTDLDDSSSWVWVWIRIKSWGQWLWERTYPHTLYGQLTLKGDNASLILPSDSIITIRLVEDVVNSSSGQRKTLMKQEWNVTASPKQQQWFPITFTLPYSNWHSAASTHFGVEAEVRSGIDGRLLLSNPGPCVRPPVKKNFNSPLIVQLCPVFKERFLKLSILADPCHQRQLSRSPTPPLDTTLFGNGSRYDDSHVEVNLLLNGILVASECISEPEFPQITVSLPFGHCQFCAETYDDSNDDLNLPTRAQTPTLQLRRYPSATIHVCWQRENGRILKSATLETHDLSTWLPSQDELASGLGLPMQQIRLK